MKKHLLTFVTLGMLFNSAWSQITLRPYVGGGVTHFAFSSSKDYDNYYMDGWLAPTKEEYQQSYKFRQTLTLGLGADIRINDQLSFEPGLRYIQKGSDNELLDLYLGVATGELKSSIQFHYIELPLNMNFNIQMGDGYLTFFGGPTVGFMADFRIKQTWKETYLGMTNEGTIDSNEDSELKKEMNNDINKIDLGLNAGVRFTYNNFFVTVAYQRSFLETLVAGPYRNENFMGSIGYAIEL